MKNPSQPTLKGPSCSNEFLDNLIRTLMDFRTVRSESAPVSTRELRILFQHVTELLLKDHACLKLDLQTPMYVIGDLFGQYANLTRLFHALGTPSDQRYLFLGNYVDRGNRSLETVALLFAFKARYPRNVYLLRGNHECRYVSCHYGFLDECLHRYNVEIWKLAIAAFSNLPVAAIVENSVFCAHSGLIPPQYCTKLTNQSELREIIAYCVKRPQNLVANRMTVDLTWSEPCLNVHGWIPHPVGLGHLFGEGDVESFCEKFNFGLVVRSNEVLNYGYEVLANGKLVTITSAQNVGTMLKNYGAVVYLQRSEKCKLILSRVKLLKPISRLQGRSALRMAFTVENSTALRGNIEFGVPADRLSLPAAPPSLTALVSQNTK